MANHWARAVFIKEFDYYTNAQPSEKHAVSGAETWGYVEHVSTRIMSLVSVIGT
jgi:hypothetical protein